MSKQFAPIELGDRVRDTVTGFKGIAVCVTTWLHGCVRIGVQPEESKDGKPVDAVYFDQSQLEVTNKGVHVPQVLAVKESPPPPITRRAAGGPGREAPGFARR